MRILIYDILMRLFPPRCGARINRLLCAFICFFPIHSSYAANDLQVSELIWNALSENDRDVINKTYKVEVIPANRFGVVLDAQTTREFTPGTNAGSALGSAFASAAYIDNSFKSNDPMQWNYSAKKDVGAGVLGAVVGSLVDRRPSDNYETMYLVRDGNGNESYIAATNDTPFRFNVGTCILINEVDMIDRNVCSDTLESFVQKHVAPATMAHREAVDPEEKQP